MHPLEPGDPAEIGPYRVLGRLGAGGMGMVFLARSRGGRAIAVKTIRPQLADDPGFRARFAREIAAARMVSGAFTCAVLDADAGSPRPWLATAYVAGPSLQQAIDTHGPMPPATLRRLGAGLAEALSSIHAAGLVHRDLKPTNVLLADDGPKVIDFGVARSADGTELTRTGALVGSAAYMSPEQAGRAEIGPPSDVFSLGAVLAFALTGRPPFGTAAAPVLLHRVVHEQPDLAGIPDDLRGIILTCLDKDPARRPTPQRLTGLLAPAAVSGPWVTGSLTGDIQAHQSDLATILDEHRSGLSRRRFLITGLTGVGAVTAAGGGAALWWRRSHGRRLHHLWSRRLPQVPSAPGILIGDRFVYRSDNGLHAVDVISGKRLWDRALHGYSLNTPVITDKSLILQCGLNAVYAVDPATGSARTVYQAEHYMTYDVHGFREGVVFITGGPDDITDKSPGLPKMDITAIAIADGSVKWSTRTGTMMDVVVPLSGELIFGRDVKSTILALDVRRGTVKWRYRSTQLGGAPVVAGNTIYVPDDRGIHALDTVTGQERWTYSAPWFPGDIVVVDGALYSTALRAFSLDAESGRLRWRSAIQAAGVASAPSISAGMLFAGITLGDHPPRGAAHGGIFGWDCATGELIWRYPSTFGKTPQKDYGYIWSLSVGPRHLIANHFADLLAFKIR